MPVSLTYPGVYIEEVSSGVRTITGVATSVTAFIGRARRGPTDRPRLVQSFAEFERLYGGLWAHSTMSYAVQQYFLNGGRDALIARVHNAAAAATLTLPAAFDLVAASEGDWAEALRARVEHVGPDRFNLIIKDMATGTIERFLNVSADADDQRFVTQVLRDESNLVRMAADPAARPDTHPDLPPGADPFANNLLSTGFGINGDDGQPLDDNSISLPSLEGQKRGLWLLEHADIFNLLCIPPLTRDLDVGRQTWDAAAAFAKRRPRHGHRRSAERLGRAGRRHRRGGPGYRHHARRERRDLFPARADARSAAGEPAGDLRALRHHRRHLRPHRRHARRVEGAGRHRSRPDRRGRARPPT